MPEMTFDWDGLINLLAKHLYSEKRIFIREIIQNAHDAIIRRRHQQPGFGGQIEIMTDLGQSSITFKDDGTGMNEDDLISFLSTVGKGETRTAREEIDGLIGQFGIGFLSAFVVADKVEVRTRKLGEATGWLWVNTGSRQYEITQCDLEKPGTRVTVFVNKGEVGLLHEQEINDVVRRYADMLLVPIHVNHSPVAINTGRMPWEAKHSDSQGIALSCLVYLESHMQDAVLEVIPFNLDGRVRAHGTLYISTTRVVALDAPRTVEVYLNRMFVCRNVPEILPQWASFVNGVINSSDLQPTAARDNIVRDDAFDRLHEELGGIIIKHLEEIRDKDPERFSRILTYHALRIRAACLAYPEFLNKFADLIEWEVNSNETDAYSLALKPKALTMPEILSRLTSGQESQPRRLLCFSTGNADHFFKMANSASTLVVDASDYFEMQLLEEIAKRRASAIRLIRVDREDAEELFRRMDDDNHPVTVLARAMSAYVDLKHTRLDVSARVFEPSSLPAILRDGEGADERERALRIFHDPRQNRDAREMAGAIIKQAPKSMKLTINAANGFVQRLAEAQKPSDPNVQQLMLGLYNSAFLSSGTMTEHNAKVLHGDYIRLMERSLGFLEREAELQTQIKQIEEERRRLSAVAGPRPGHRIFFMLTPFAKTYQGIRDAIREVVEDRWECQLFLASDRKYEDRVLDNVRIHMHHADAFIAELTEANPNVMFELGAAFSDRRDRAIVQLLDSSRSTAYSREGSKLPADLASIIYIDYAGHLPSEGARVDSDTNSGKLADYLEHEMKRDVRINEMLKGSREKYVSFNQLKRIAKTLVSDASYRRLVESIPTRERWKRATEDEIKQLIVDRDEQDAAELLLLRVNRFFFGDEG